MVRTIFTCAVVALVGLASSAYAQTYADFNLDTNVGLTYASPASVIQATFGTIEQTKAVCSEIPDCIGVLYQASAGGANLLRYDAGGSIGAAAGYSSVSWRYDAKQGPVCYSTTDVFADSRGSCTCNDTFENQDTGFGCVRILLPSGVVGRRSKRMARNHIMPGRDATPSF